MHRYTQLCSKRALSARWLASFGKLLPKKTPKTKKQQQQKNQIRKGFVWRSMYTRLYVCIQGTVAQQSPAHHLVMVKKSGVVAFAASFNTERQDKVVIFQ